MAHDNNCDKLNCFAIPGCRANSVAAIFSFACGTRLAAYP